jgi:ataxin-10
MIASTFFDLGEYSISAIDKAIPNVSSLASTPTSLTSSSGTNSPTSPILTPPELSFCRIYLAPTPEVPPTNGELDMLLPSVCEALVLMMQCLVTFALTSEDEELDFPIGDNPKDFLNAATVEEGVGMAEIVISAFQWTPRPNKMLTTRRKVFCKGSRGYCLE